MHFHGTGSSRATTVATALVRPTSSPAQSLLISLSNKKKYALRVGVRLGLQCTVIALGL